MRRAFRNVFRRAIRPGPVKKLGSVGLMAAFPLHTTYGTKSLEEFFESKQKEQCNKTIKHNAVIQRKLDDVKMYWDNLPELDQDDLPLWLSKVIVIDEKTNQCSPIKVGNVAICLTVEPLTEKYKVRAFINSTDRLPYVPVHYCGLKPSENIYEGTVESTKDMTTFLETLLKTNVDTSKIPDSEKHEGNLKQTPDFADTMLETTAFAKDAAIHTARYTKEAVGAGFDIFTAAGKKVHGWAKKVNDEQS